MRRLFRYADPEPGVFDEDHISAYFWHNSTYPETGEYKELEKTSADWRLWI
ncbi:MAG: hypothetical protein ACRDTK_13100 [Mycobacterium sp.]